MAREFIRGAAALFLLFSIGGCASDFATREAIPADEIRAVVDDLKRQVSIYADYQNSEEGRRRLVAQSTTNPCGNGLIDFDIKSAKITLLTTTEKSGSFGVAAAGAPAGLASLGGGLSFSASRADTQELTFSALPLNNSAYRYYGEENVQTAPIAGALINLRDSLIKSSKTENRICFQTSSAKDDNTFKLGVTRSSTFNVNGALGLAPLAVTASGETKGSTGNTLVVSFVPSMPNAFWFKSTAHRGAGTNRTPAWKGESPIPDKVPDPLSPGTGPDCPPGSTRPGCVGTWGFPGAVR